MSQSSGDFIELGATFQAEVLDAFTNYGANKSGVIAPNELDAPLRQLSLPVDVPQVAAIVAKHSQHVEQFDFTGFTALVNEILVAMSAISQRRKGLQSELSTQAAIAVLENHKGTIKSLFVDHATTQPNVGPGSTSDRAISTEILLQMCRSLALVPSLLDENFIRKALVDHAYDLITYDLFPEVLLLLANGVSVHDADANVPPHVRLHEFLRAIERFKDEPQKDDRVLERLLAERDERSATNAAADDSHARQPPKAPPPNPFATSGEERLSAADVAANAERVAARSAMAQEALHSCRMSMAPAPEESSSVISAAGRKDGVWVKGPEAAFYHREPEAHKSKQEIGRPEAAEGGPLHIHIPSNSKGNRPGSAPQGSRAAQKAMMVGPPIKTSPRVHERDAPPYLQSQQLAATATAEVEALRMHVAGLEHNLAQAEHKLREAGVHATRLRAEGTPGRSAYRFTEDGVHGKASSLTTDDEHKRTVEQFAHMRQKVATLAARNSALEQTSKLVAGTEKQTVARERQSSARETSLRKECDLLKQRNRELELKLMQSSKKGILSDVNNSWSFNTGVGASAGPGGVPRTDARVNFADTRSLIAKDGRSGHSSSDYSLSSGGGGLSGTEKVALKGMEEELKRVKEQLASAQRENAALRAQMDLLENNAMEKVGEYLEAGEPQTLLQYATTMKMRPLGAGRVAPKKDSGGAGGGGTAAATVSAPSTAAATTVGGGEGTTKKGQIVERMHNQWVEEVTGFSSERDKDKYAAHQLIGPPKVYPMHGHTQGAWQPTALEGGGGESKTDFVEVKFGHPMYISTLEVYESFGAGSVIAISLWSGEENGWDAVWKGPSTSKGRVKEARLFAPQLEPRGYASQHARLEIEVTPIMGTGGEEVPDAAAQIDAIRAVGLRAPAEEAAKEAPPRRNTTDKKDAKDTSSSGKESPRKDDAFHIPGSTAGVMTTGPRYKQLEGQLTSLKAGHAREMRQLRAYVDQLRSYGEGLRSELDSKKGEIASLQEELRARPPRQ